MLGKPERHAEASAESAGDAAELTPSDTAPMRSSESGSCPIPAVSGAPQPAEAARGPSGYYDVNFDWVPTSTLRSGARTVYPTLHKVYCAMDYIGEKLANGLGLTQSRYQYAVDEYNRREERKRRKAEMERQRKMEEEIANGFMSYDEDANDENDGLGIPYVPPLVTTRVEASASLQQPLLASSAQQQ